MMNVINLMMSAGERVPPMDADKQEQIQALHARAIARSCIA
jgi:hypothetical protein